jgi:hypothetical protein
MGNLPERYFHSLAYVFKVSRTALIAVSVSTVTCNSLFEPRVERNSRFRCITRLVLASPLFVQTMDPLFSVETSGKFVA